VKVQVSNKEESPVMDNGGYSDSQLVRHFRSVLDAVTTVSCCRFRKVLWVLSIQMFSFYCLRE